jgi:hypothetical protein
LALQVFREDSEAIKNAIGASTELRAQLASYLISNQKLNDALGLWNTLNPDEKREQHLIGEEVLKGLAGAKKFHAALDIARELTPEDQARPMLNQFLNGGFEAATTPGGAGVFGWQITSVPQAQAAIDQNQYHSGARSLRLVFKSTSTLALNTAAQVVVVEPRKQYRFECWVRTDDLKSGGAPTFEVVDESDSAALGPSASVPTGTNNWLPLTIDFGTRANTEAVRFRISRASCGQDPVCPIFGTVWYDDFSLQLAGRIGGSEPTRHANTHGSRTMGKS